MPKLPIYEAKEVGGVRSTPESFGAGASRAKAEAAGNVGSSLQGLIGGLYKNKVDRDVSKLQASMATAQADLTVDQQNRLKNADPNDDQWAENFLTTSVDKTLGSIGETAQTKEGQQYFQQASARVRAGFQESSYAHMTELAGIAAVQNAQATANALSTTVASDPTQFDSVMSQAELNIATMPGLTTEMRLKALPAVQKTLAMSAAKAWAQLNPDYADQLVESGKYSKFLDGEDVIAVKSYAESERRARRADANASEAEANRQRERMSEDTRNDYMSNLVDPTSGQVTVPAGWTTQMLRDPNLKPEDKAALFGLPERINNAAEKSDPMIFNDLNRRALLPPSDPSRATFGEIMGSVGNGVTMAQANFLADRINGKDDPAKQTENDLLTSAKKVVRSQIAPAKDMFGNSTGAGEAAYNRFLNWFEPEYQKKISAGKTPAQLLSVDGPDSLITGLAKFAPTPDEAASDMLSSFEQRKAGMKAVKAQMQEAKKKPPIDEFMK